MRGGGKDVPVLFCVVVLWVWGGCFMCGCDCGCVGVC